MASALAADAEFDHDFITWVKPNWLRLFSGEFNISAGEPISYLEIGCFEGRSMIFMMEEVLTHPSSRATCVDPFIGVDADFGRFEEAANFDRGALKSRFLSNLEPYSRKLTTLQATSGQALRMMTPGSFDVIYIDGDHSAAAALEDAVLSWPLLRSGGLLIFDDYGAEDNLSWPKVGIDGFLAAYAPQLTVVTRLYQVYVLKH